MARVRHMVFFHPEDRGLFLVSPASVDTTVGDGVELAPGGTCSLFPGTSGSTGVILDRRGDIEAAEGVAGAVVFTITFHLLPIVVS